MKIKHYAISAIISIYALQSYALSWQDLWQSKNQQAKNFMQKSDFTAAEHTFKNEDWQAVAAFRAKDYQQAANLFAKSNSDDANYNLGNALAHLGKYQEALAAYDKVLAENKNHQDAKYNKTIIEKLLQQQKKQQAENKQPTKNQQKTPEPKNNEHSKNQQSQKNPKTNQNNNEQQKATGSTTKPKKSKNINTNTTPKLKKQQEKSPEDGNNQMQEQWLKLIPDDPGGLLREKFKRDYLRRRGELNQ